MTPNSLGAKYNSDDSFVKVNEEGIVEEYEPVFQDELELALKNNPNLTETQIKKIANIARMQDGAIWDKYLFRFGADGLCIVYDMDNLGTAEMEAPELCRFWLDKIELIKPHSNAVVFGSSYYAPEDEFPLLYSNIYNNYARAENQMVGVCCVYRIQNKYRSQKVIKSYLL